MFLRVNQYGDVVYFNPKRYDCQFALEFFYGLLCKNSKSEKKTIVKSIKYWRGRKIDIKSKNVSKSHTGEITFASLLLIKITK